MAIHRAMTRHFQPVVLASLVLVSVLAASARAADAPSLVASGGRAGAGLRIGLWEVRDLNAPAGGEASETPAFEGWLQKGLDPHLVMETTLGYWQRTQSRTEPGPISGEVELKVVSYLVPMMTTLKILPLTRSSSPLEPYVSGGVGVVMGIDQEQVSSTDPTVIEGKATEFHAGLGVQAGGGLDWNTGSPFGLTIGARYQWASFSEDVGGRAMYRGPLYIAGVTYRFQGQ